VRHEPEDTTRVRNNHEVWQVFENAGWNVYFDRLKGSNEEIATEFALNLREGSSRVRGIEIPVTEEAIAEVSGLPQNGQVMVFKKVCPSGVSRSLFTGGRKHRAEGSRIRPKLAAASMGRSSRVRHEIYDL
jgi:hypothetical protein